MPSLNTLFNVRRAPKKPSWGGFLNPVVYAYSNGNNPIYNPIYQPDIIHIIQFLTWWVETECFRVHSSSQTASYKHPQACSGLRSVLTPSKLKDWSLLRKVQVWKSVRPDSRCPNTWPNTGEAALQDGVQPSSHTPLTTAMFMLWPEERGVEGAIFFKLETLSPNKGGVGRHQSPASYNAVQGSLPESCRIVHSQQHKTTGTVHNSLIMQNSANNSI